MSNRVYILQKDLPYVKAGAKYELDVPDGTYVCDSATAEFREGVKWDGLGIAAVENNPEWFLPEENKSNDSFQWDDKLVEQVCNLCHHDGWHKFGEGILNIIKNFKQSHTPKPKAFGIYMPPEEPQAENKPDWEIVDSTRRYFHNNDPLHGYETIIKSVKRLSDNITFSVGDEVDSFSHYKNLLIKKFETLGSLMMVYMEKAGEDHGFKISDVQKSKNPPQPHKEEQDGIFDLLAAITDKYQDEKLKYQMLEKKVDAMCEDACLKFMHYTEHIMDDDDWMGGDELKSMSQVYKEFTQWKNKKQ